MTAANKLDKEIFDYLPLLTEKQKQAVLTVVKTFAEEQESDHWEDKAFIDELDRRAAELQSGKVKALTLTELQESAVEYKKARTKTKSKK